jgi:hypothetical protein
MKAAKPRQKKTVQQLLKSRRRDQRKKGQRLAKRELNDRVVAALTNKRTHCNVVGIRRQDEVLFGMRTGLFGHPTTTTLKVKDEQIVGANEKGEAGLKELGEIVTQLGLLTLGAMLNYNLAWGPEGLAKALARWANIDLSELQAQADAEALVAVKAGIEATKVSLAEAAAMPDQEGQEQLEFDFDDSHDDCEQCTGYSPYDDAPDDGPTEEAP